MTICDNTCSVIALFLNHYESLFTKTTVYVYTSRY